MFALESLAIISGIELLLWWKPLWNGRKLLAWLLLLVLAIANVAVAFEFPGFWAILIVFTSVYRCINLARVAAARIQADYLFHASRQTSLWLIGTQLVIVALAACSRHYRPDTTWWWSFAAGLELLCASGLLVAAQRHVRATRPPKLGEPYAVKDLPTVTVAIPARNETTDLEECLQSVVASTYPKLEIVVLDDCSQNKRTPEIIRGFAHNGVRFIAGETPPGQWLAKNYAYAQLAAAANGDVLLFCGVDTRFEPDSINALVRILLQKQKSMLSILPRNLTPKSATIAGWFMQPNRYAWELALPRRFVRRPPVLSTCWLITREALAAAGGFKAVRRKGVPESYLARATANSGDTYSFLQADPTIGVSSRKNPDEQRATAIRTRYLQLHRRPELTAAVGLAELTVLVGPLPLFLISLTGRHWIVAGLFALSFILNSLLYSRIFSLAYRQFTLKSLWMFVPAVLYDIGLLNYSMWQYEFGEVLWKGRNVCIPVMRVIPELPKS